MQHDADKDRLRDLLELDDKLARLILGRMRAKAALMDESGLSGEARAKLGQEIEKTARKSWERLTPRGLKDPGAWRSLFYAVNALGLDPLPPDKKSRDFSLSPRAGEARAVIPIPGDALFTRAFLVRAALSETPCALLNPSLASGPHDLYKALNSLGARLFREGGAIRSRGGKLGMDGKSVHVGSEAVDAYIAVFLAAAEPGVVRIMGDPRLKGADLTPLNEPLRALGARINCLRPGSKGLPIKVESSGEASEVIELSPRTPPLAIAALAAVAPAFPHGLKLILPELDAATASVLAFLERIPGACTVNGKTLTLAKGPFSPPEETLCPMDPELAAVFGVLPRLIGGKMELVGAYVADNPHWTRALDALAALGLKTTLADAPNALFVEPSPESPSPAAPAVLDAAFIPALAASSVLIRAGESKRFRIRGEIDAVALTAFADALGFSVHIEDDVVEIVRDASAEATLSVRSALGPLMTIAAALASFVRPGINLAHPGEALELWPEFWSLYNRLPDCDATTPVKKQPSTLGDEPKRPVRRKIG